VQQSLFFVHAIIVWLLCKHVAGLGPAGGGGGEEQATKKPLSANTKTYGRVRMIIPFVEHRSTLRWSPWDEARRRKRSIVRGER
jgi:hypothetical protein